MNQQDLATLNKKFAIASALTFEEDASGLIIARIANAHAQSSIALQGAHVMTFQPVGEQPVIWLSPVAKLAPGKSIRGGVPICWPWFGAHSSEPSFPGHGFARTVPWQVSASEAQHDGSTRITFVLPQNSIPAAQWPHACNVWLTVTIGKTLTLELSTQNTESAYFGISEALHTYFAISDVDNVRIKGMKGCTYLDKVGDPAKRVEPGDIRIESEVDRVYIFTKSDCLIEDTGLNRRIRIAKSDSLSTVVWNPWIEKSTKMGDFGSPTGYRGMVCVESANAADNAVVVMPNEVHTLRVVYSVEKI